MQRRTFIKNTALATAAVGLSHSAFAADRKIKIAIIGTGWFGTDLLLPAMLATQRFDVVALCDVNQHELQKPVDTIQKAGQPKPELFADYRKLYAMPGLEAVVIASPTHWHALQFVEACQKGLHVFLEKPVSYDVAESKAMLAAHQKAGNVVVVDFERIHFGINEQVKAYIDSGEAGKIEQVLVNLHSGEDPIIEKPIPATFDYDAYCGPAPVQKFMCPPTKERPYWRGLYAFGRGTMVDWGSHYLHNARKVMNLGLPTSVSAVGGTLKNTTIQHPDHINAFFDYNGLPVQYAQSTWGYQSPTPDTNIGVFYFGEKATIFSGEFGWEVYPAGGKPKINHGEIGRAGGPV